MTDRFTDPLETFVQRAMDIAHDTTQTIHTQRMDFERLIAAVAEYQRQKVQDQLKEQENVKE